MVIRGSLQRISRVFVALKGLPMLMVELLGRLPIHYPSSEPACPMAMSCPATKRRV